MSADLARLRRLIAEPTDATYTDATLESYLRETRTFDSHGRKPGDLNYVDTYDYNLAASKVWEEKASAVACIFDYTGDGASLSRSQIVQYYLRTAAFLRSRAAASVLRVVRDGTQGVLAGTQTETEEDEFS